MTLDVAYSPSSGMTPMWSGGVSFAYSGIRDFQDGVAMMFGSCNRHSACFFPPMAAIQSQATSGYLLAFMPVKTLVPTNPFALPPPLGRGSGAWSQRRLVLRVLTRSLN